MERQEINGIETRRRGSTVEQWTGQGWKPTSDPYVLARVRDIEFNEMVHRNPLVYHAELTQRTG